MSLKSDLNAMLEYAYALSVRRNAYRIAVVADGRLFSSITDAAYWLARNRPDLWENSKAAQDKDAYRVMSNLITRTRRWCNQGLDQWFLAEDSDPATWDFEGAEFVIEDLRKK